MKCLTIISLLVFSFSWSKTKIEVPVGSLRPTSYQDLKDHPLPSDTYGEFWTYYFDFDSSFQVILNFTRANLGSFKDPVCGADVSFIHFKGKNYTVAREYPKRKFQWDDSKQKLNVHEKIWFEGALPDTHRVYFYTEKKGTRYLMDLRFTNIEQGWSWGNGTFKMGKEKIGLFFHIPRATVKGIVAINNDTLRVTGTGYMDHVFQSTLGTKLVKRGFRYQKLGDQVEAAFLMHPTEKYKYHPVGYGIQKQQNGYTLLSPNSVQMTESKRSRKVRMPLTLDIEYPQYSLSLERKNDDQIFSVLSEFKGFQKWAIKKYLGGEVLHFRGRGKGNEEALHYSFFGMR